MTDNASDIKSCLEYLEKHVEDDDEVELILYQVEEGDSLDSGSDQEYSEGNDEDVQDVYDNDEADGSTLSTDVKALPTSTLPKRENSNSSTSKSTLTANKTRSVCGETLTANKYNTKIENNDQTIASKLHEFGETKGNVVKSDDPGETNDEINYVERESNIKDISSPKPLGRYQCMMCPFNAVRKCQLTEHLIKHSDERPYKCSVCEKRFKCEKYLKGHINIHAEINQFRCKHCDATYASSSRLVRHKRLFHSGMKPMKCTECEFSTMFPAALKKHKSVHMTERPFKCSHCTYSSTNSVKLKTHMRVHTEEKRYECDICNSRFREANLLRNHREIHFSNGTNLFQCNRCPAKLRTRGTLRVHMQQLHNEGIQNKPHSCPHCERSYTLKACLLRHMEIHT